MKYLKQVVYILLFTLVGQVLERIVPFPIPAAIWGLTLLFLSLCIGVIKVEDVEDVSKFLISILPVLFVAPSVNLLAYWDVISTEIVPVVIINVLTTLLVFAVTALVTGWLLKRKGGEKDA